MSLSGLDVSNNQGTVNWSAVKAAGYDFAVCKISEGDGFFDPFFDQNWAAMKAVGLVRGAYHFSRFDQSTTAAAEAAWFHSIAPNWEPGDFYMLDDELGNFDQGGMADQWLRLSAQSEGFRGGLYSYPFYVQQYLQNPDLATYPLWLASWQTVEPNAPQPWKTIALWQNNAFARVNGINGPVDTDQFIGTLDQLKALGKPAPQGPPPPPARPWTGRHFRVTTATHFRPLPILTLPQGPLLPIGTRVIEINAWPPLPFPRETAHWLYARTSGDLRGYALKNDLAEYKP